MAVVLVPAALKCWVNSFAASSKCTRTIAQYSQKPIVDRIDEHQSLGPLTRLNAAKYRRMCHLFEIGEHEPLLLQTNVMTKRSCSPTVNSSPTSMSTSSDCFLCLKILVAKKSPIIAFYPTMSKLCNVECSILTAKRRLVMSSIHCIIG
jgi:hypothetical protein